MNWKEFSSMGTDISLMIESENDYSESLEQAMRVIIDFDERFSRFKENNELSKFNLANGGWRFVSPMMSLLLKQSKKFYQETNAVFDPTVIGSLELVGYNQSFNESRKHTSETKEKLNLKGVERSHSNRQQMSDLKIFARFVCAPKHFRIDSGGIGKGLIVDYLSEKIFKDISNYWISAGGDLLLCGSGRNGQGWEVSVQNPYRPEENIFMISSQGEKRGVATSGVGKRQGVFGDYKWNHIIDTKTGLSIDNNILSVTVISTNAQRADVYAKTVLMLGKEAGLIFIEETELSEALLFLKNGTIIKSKQMGKYLK